MVGAQGYGDENCTHRHDVFVVGGEGNAVDAVLVTRELGHTGFVLNIL